MLTTGRFVCLTSDVTGSRETPDREGLQLRIEASLAEANGRLFGALAVPLTVTVGDEWQGLFISLEAAYEADFLLRSRLCPAAFCTGLGVGGLSTPLKSRTAAMDGECFHRSRAALELARRRRVPAVRVESGEPLLDEPANAICLLLAAVSVGWTERQLRSVAAFRELGTEKAAADSLGVSQPALHKSLAGARGKEFVEAFDQLLAFSRRFPLGAEGPASAGGEPP